MKAVLAGLELALCMGGLASHASPQTDAIPPVLATVIGEWNASNGAVMRAVPVAAGRGLYSTYTDGDYEAVTLWTYHAPTNAVRALEANSVGMVMLYVGEVESDEALTLSCYSNHDPGELARQLTISREGDALHSTLVFYENGRPTAPQRFVFTRVGS